MRAPFSNVCVQVEGRTNIGKAAAVKTGDVVEFWQTTVQILDVMTHESFRRMLECRGPSIEMSKWTETVSRCEVCVVIVTRAYIRKQNYNVVGSD